MNHVTYIVLDFETTSKNPYTCQPTQLAAYAVDNRRLEIQDKFSSYIKIIEDEKECAKAGVDTYSEEAIAKTKILPDILRDSPTQKVVWQNFVQWVTNFNYKKTKWTAPIKVGYNNNNYDDVILDRLAKLYGPYDDEYRCEALFHPLHTIDLMKVMFLWFENSPQVNSLSFDSMRDFLGMDDSKAHNAEFDCEQEAQVLIRYLKLFRHYSPKIKFKGSFGFKKEEKE